MNTFTPPSVNHEEFFAYLEDELDQASHQFADTYLSEFTDLEGSNRQYARDELLEAMGRRLQITVHR